jgi:hypothetical protein
MKFFTPELYVRFNSAATSVANRANADWERALAAYRKHLRSIRLKLPASVACLASDSCLHDAEYLGFTKMTMPAMTGDVALIAVRKDGAVNFLVYVLDGEPMVTRPLEADVFDVSQPHWLYDEMDVAGVGVFQHDILLSDGRKLSVRFTAFDMLPGSSTKVVAKPVRRRRAVPA